VLSKYGVGIGIAQTALWASVATMLSPPVMAQTGASPLAFEVASVKPAKIPPDGPRLVSIFGGPGTLDPTTITVEAMTLRILLMRAYNVSESQLVGPSWLSDTRFDIVAKVAPNATHEQVVEMWQTLFAERFKLTLHRETKELSVYTLVVAKGGPTFHEASDFIGGGDDLTRGASTRDGARPNKMVPERMPMSALADMLTRTVGRPVIDKTGLTGRYLISLQWQRDDLPAAVPEVQSLPNIFVALQEQLGLKLEARKKEKVVVLVIDHVEQKPVEN